MSVEWIFHCRQFRKLADNGVFVNATVYADQVFMNVSFNVQFV